jgi:hypothetical protein
MTYTHSARSSGSPMRLVPAMLRNGTMPVRLNPRIATKTVVSRETYRLAFSLPSTSSAMPVRTKSSTHSIADWNRPGTSVARRAATTKSETMTSAAMIRTSSTRLNSNHVPEKRIGGGKKSLIVGGWNPPPSAASGSTVTRLVRAHSLVVVGSIRATPQPCGQPAPAPRPSWSAESLTHPVRATA